MGNINKKKTINLMKRLSVLNGQGILEEAQEPISMFDLIHHVLIGARLGEPMDTARLQLIHKFEEEFHSKLEFSVPQIEVVLAAALAIYGGSRFRGYSVLYDEFTEEGD